MFGWGEVGSAGFPVEAHPGVRRLEGIRLLSAGHNVLVLLQEPGKVVVVRTHQGGDGRRVQGKHKPVKCEQQVRAASCSDDAVLLLCEDGSLLSVDATVKHLCPRPLQALSGKAVRQVACGSRHSIALAADGRVYTWGQDSRGQLGLGKSKSGAASPQHLKVLGSIPVVQVSAGGQQSFALTASGAVFAWGGNHRGQLGLGDTEDRRTPTAVQLLRGKKTTHVACGDEHTAVLTKDGAVFTFGSSQFGQLGHNSLGDEQRPRLVGELWGSKVIQLACGSNHTLVLTHSGRVYSFGRAEEGQLGQRELAHPSVPLLVQLPQDASKFTNIYAGGNVSFATSDGLGSSMDAVNAVTKCCLENKIKVWTFARVPTMLLEVKKNIKATFSSAFCANQSFLDQSHDRHFQTSQTLSGLNLTRANRAFKELVTRHDVLEKVVEAVIQLLPSLEKAPVRVEGLRIYLLLSELLHTIQEHHLPQSVALAQEFAQALSLALQSLSPEAQRVIVDWWVSMPSLAQVRHVQLWTTALCNVLSLGPTYRIPIQNVILTLHSMYNANNRTAGRPMIPNTYFSLEFNPVFISVELRCWRSVTKNQNSTDPQPLILCRFPFLMNLNSRKIAFDANVECNQAEYDRMVWTLDGEVRQRDYLVLQLRRSSLFEDTFRQLRSVVHSHFKMPLWVYFDQEKKDTMVYRKDLFQHLFRDMVSKNPSMFFFNDATTLAWFSCKATEEDKERFFMFGVLCGMAVCNQSIMHFPVPLVLFKKLLNIQPSLEDMVEFEPAVGSSLQNILNYDNRTIEDMFMDFVITWERSEVDLDPQNPGKDLTGQNKFEFVEAYIDHVFNTSVASVFQEFRRGFYQVCDEEMVKLFEPKELQEMLLGKEAYEWSKMKQNTRYEDGYHAAHPTILMFWEVFDGLTEEQRKDFLWFVTGSRTVPLLGMDHVFMRVRVKLVQDGSPDQYFPESLTCHAILDLPTYSTKKIMQSRLTEALHPLRGFEE